MTVNVVTVFAPRKSRKHWREDYIDLLELQRKTAERFGHRQVVVTDRPEYLAGRGLQLLEVELPENLMRAQLAGQIAWLARAEAQASATLLADSDVLVARELSPAFREGFDLGLTARADPLSPVNNGAMYVPAGCAEAALPFFRAALGICGEHWAADQQAISAIAAPIAADGETVERVGARVRFLFIKIYNVSPTREGVRHKRNPFVVHFKGPTKAWAATYAKAFILGGAR